MIYLMLDPKDITHIVGEISDDELMKELGYRSKSTFNSWLSRNNRYRGCVIVEKYFTDEKDELKSCLIYEKDGRRYYISSDCTVYVIYKNGKKRSLSIYKKKHHSDYKYFCKISDHEIDIVRTLALCFLGMKKNERCILRGNLKLENINVMSIHECHHITGKMSKVNKKVGYYVDGKLTKKFRSARQAGKELYISYQTVSDYCNKKVKNPMMDLRWI